MSMCDGLCQKRITLSYTCILLKRSGMLKFGRFTIALFKKWSHQTWHWLVTYTCIKLKYDACSFQTNRNISSEFYPVVTHFCRNCIILYEHVKGVQRRCALLHTSIVWSATMQQLTVSASNPYFSHTVSFGFLFRSGKLDAKCGLSISACCLSSVYILIEV